MYWTNLVRPRRLFFDLRARAWRVPDKVTFINRAVCIMGIMGYAMTIPQIMKIWLEQNAAGVSAVSWITYMVSACFWIAYGLIHKRRTIVILYSGWVFLYSWIIVGALKFG